MKLCKYYIFVWIQKKFQLFFFLNEMMFENIECRKYLSKSYLFYSYVVKLQILI